MGAQFAREFEQTARSIGVTVDTLREGSGPGAVNSEISGLATLHPFLRHSLLGRSEVNCRFFAWKTIYRKARTVTAAQVL